MKTYKEFLLEVISREAALRKLHTIHDKQYSKNIDGVNARQVKRILTNRVGKNMSRDGFWQSHEHFEEPSRSGYKHRYIARIPMSKVSTVQPFVGRRDVEDKIKTTKQSHPKVPYFIYHKPSDTYHLVDGNHRATMRHLRDFSHIRGLVIDSHHIENEYQNISKNYIQTSPGTQKKSLLHKALEKIGLK